jgi:hypothetical protein
MCFYIHFFYPEKTTSKKGGEKAKKTAVKGFMCTLHKNTVQHKGK